MNDQMEGVLCIQLPSLSTLYHVLQIYLHNHIVSELS